MARPVRRWVRVRGLTKEERATTGARCDAFVADVLTPQFLPVVVSTEWNYPILLHGKWRANRYSFIIRYRSGWGDNAGEESDSAWARLDHDEEFLTRDRFQLMWRRHSGQWLPYRGPPTLDDALQAIETDPLMRPPL